MTKFENEIQKNGYVIYTCEGDSMMPLLREHKDIVVIKRLTAPLKKNDVVLYKRPSGAYVLHRIVKLCGLGQYKIMGDNREYAETVPEEWIIGILTEVIKDGRHIFIDSNEYKEYLKKISHYHSKQKIRKYQLALKDKIKVLLWRVPK